MRSPAFLTTIRSAPHYSGRCARPATGFGPSSDRGATMSDKVRLRGHRGQDEVNARGVSYKVSPWGTVCVPAEDVGPLLKVGGFHVASEDDESADHSSLGDVAEVVGISRRSRSLDAVGDPAKPELDVASHAINRVHIKRNRARAFAFGGALADHA